MSTVISVSIQPPQQNLVCSVGKSVLSAPAQPNLERFRACCLQFLWASHEQHNQSCHHRGVVAQNNDKYYRQLKATLKTKAAKSSTAPSAARLDFFDQKNLVSAIPTERQISRSRSSITAQTRIDAPGESPAELSEMVIRRSDGTEAVHQLPTLSLNFQKWTRRRQLSHSLAMSCLQLHINTPHRVCRRTRFTHDGHSSCWR